MTWVVPPPQMVVETQHVSKEVHFEHHLPAHGNPCQATSKSIQHLQTITQALSQFQSSSLFICIIVHSWVCVVKFQEWMPQALSQFQSSSLFIGIIVHSWVCVVEFQEWMPL
jgi:hypothetical protein